MASLKYAIAVFALVSASLAQNGAPTAPDNAGQPTVNSQEPAKTSTPVASPAVPPDSIELEPIQTAQPVYPNAAREQNIRGKVLVIITVATTGEVQNTNVLSGDPLLRDAAVEAAKRWKFKPFVKDGQPVWAIGRLSFDFGSSGGAGDENPKASADSWSVKVAVDDSSGFPRWVRVSQGVTQGLILKSVAPKYPKAAKKARVQGSVVIAAKISTEGTIKGLKWSPVLQSLSMLRSPQ